METAENLTFNVQTQTPCNQNIIRSSFVWLVVSISRDVRTSVISTIVIEGTLIWWNLQVGISKSKMPTSIGVLFFQNSSIRFFHIFTMIPGGYPAGTHWVSWKFFKLKNHWWFLSWVAKPSSKVLPYTKPSLVLCLHVFKSMWQTAQDFGNWKQSWIT